MTLMTHVRQPDGTLTRATRNRHRDAWHIWMGGASNPRAVARALVDAIDQATELGSDHAKDPAVQMILDHLCFLCGLPQPSLLIGLEGWTEIQDAVEHELAKDPTHS